jgi:acyl-CoA dehydrogenase
VILRASGRHTVPLPIAETIVAGWLLARGGIEIPTGPITILSLEPDGNRLTGVADNVPWGRACAHAVVAARGRVALVSTAAAAEATDGENLAREPRDRLRFDGARLLAVGNADFADDVVRVYGAMARSAQIAGALEGILTQAVRYACKRAQFGRPLSAFQVIQHELAKLAGDVAAAGVAAEVAFRASARADSEPGFDPRFEVAVANTRIGDSIDQATGIAHQVHGAMGFTYEHGLHFATRRLWSWRAEYGTDAAWAAELGQSALAGGADALWPDLTARARRP